MHPLYGSIGELRFGVPKNSPLLAKKHLEFKDFADQRFAIIASRHFDSFIQDFRAICSKEEFVPRIEFVTSTSYRDFWMQDHGDSIVFLDITQGNEFTSADEYLANQYKPIQPFGRKPYYIIISIIARNEEHGPALQHYLDTVRSIEEERFEKFKQTIESTNKA